MFTPFVVSMDNKKVIVAGGGEVAFRKIRKLLDSGAIVKVIAPRISPVICAIKSDRLKLIQDKIKMKHFNGCFMGIAATDKKKINKKIVKHLIKKNILVNSADNGGNVIFPAVIKKGDLTIGISSGSASPLFSKKMAAKIEETLKNYDIERYLALIKKMRDTIKNEVEDKKERKNKIIRATEELIGQMESVKLNFDNK